MAVSSRSGRVLCDLAEAYRTGCRCNDDRKAVAWMDVVILKGRHLWMYWLCIWGSSLPAIVATILAVENALELEFFLLNLTSWSWRGSYLSICALVKPDTNSVLVEKRTLIMCRSLLHGAEQSTRQETSSAFTETLVPPQDAPLLPPAALYHQSSLGAALEKNREGCGAS